LIPLGNLQQIQVTSELLHLVPGKVWLGWLLLPMVA
jgi:hypothetical protein